MPYQNHDWRDNAWLRESDHALRLADVVAIAAICVILAFAAGYWA